MKITIEQYGVEYSISKLSDDLDIYEMGQRLRELLFAMGFQQESIDEIIDAQ